MMGKSCPWWIASIMKNTKFPWSTKNKKNTKHSYGKGWVADAVVWPKLYSLQDTKTYCEQIAYEYAQSVKFTHINL